MNNKRFVTFFIFLFVLLFFIAAGFYWNRPAWRIYKSDKYGFSFKYPDSWVIKNFDDQSVIVAVGDPNEIWDQNNTGAYDFVVGFYENARALYGADRIGQYDSLKDYLYSKEAKNWGNYVLSGPGLLKGYKRYLVSNITIGPDYYILIEKEGKDGIYSLSFPKTSALPSSDSKRGRNARSPNEIERAISDSFEFIK